MASQSAPSNLTRTGSGNSPGSASLNNSLHSIRERRESLSASLVSPVGGRPPIDWRGHSNSPYQTTAGYRPPNVAPDVYTPPIFAMPKTDYFGQQAGRPSPAPSPRPTLLQAPQARPSPPLLERRGIVRSDSGTYRVQIVPPDSRQAELLRADVYGEIVGNSLQSPLAGAKKEQVDALFEDAQFMRVCPPRGAVPSIKLRPASPSSASEPSSAHSAGGIKGLVVSLWARLAQILSRAQSLGHLPWTRPKPQSPHDAENPAPPPLEERATR